MTIPAVHKFYHVSVISERLYCKLKCLCWRYSKRLFRNWQSYNVNNELNKTLNNITILCIDDQMLRSDSEYFLQKALHELSASAEKYNLPYHRQKRKSSFCWILPKNCHKWQSGGTNKNLISLIVDCHVWERKHK